MIRRLLFLINALCILALFVAFSSPYISPKIYYIPQLFGIVYEYILLVNILFLFLWLAFYKKYAIYSFLPLLGSLLFFPRIYQFSGKTTSSNGDFTLLSYNVRKFEPIKKGVQPSKVFEFVKTKNPNVTCLQEYSHSRYSKYGKKTFGAMYSYVHKEGEIATFSKYPIVRKKRIGFDKKNYAKGIYSDIVVGDGDTLRIINVHLESNQLSPKNKQDLERVVENKGRGIQRLRTVVGKLKRASLHRAEQIEKLETCIKKSPYSVVLCGDFNDIPMSNSYHKIQNLLDDSFVEAGRGFGKTFLEGIINVRIDYVFSNRKLVVHQVGDVVYSDHKPVFVSISKSLE